jgi:hypothetical protein
VSLLLIGCGAVSERVAPSVPTGLDPSHVLLAIDYIVHHPALDGVYDPRSVTPRWATGALAPPALLVWWRPELPADANAQIVRWRTATIDLSKAGHSVEHPVWSRCVRLDGDQAAEVAGLARSLPIDHLVEQGGGRYGLVLRPIHEDEIDDVDCP